MGTLSQRLLATSIYVATCNNGEQHTFIFLFWSQVSYNVIHIVRYNVALLSLQKKWSVHLRKENVQGRDGIPKSNECFLGTRSMWWQSSGPTFTAYMKTSARRKALTKQIARPWQTLATDCRTYDQLTCLDQIIPLNLASLWVAFTNLHLKR